MALASTGERVHPRRAIAPAPTNDYAHIEVRPLTGSIGAEVHGIDVREVDDAAMAELRDAWLRHKVLFYRDQDLTREQHIEFGRRWADLEIHPFAALPGHPEIIAIDSSPEKFYAAQGWHSDVSFREAPPMGSILRGVIVPPVGGDTLWADMELAYEILPDHLKEEIDGRYAVHSFVNVFGKDASAEKRAEKLAEFPPQRHPMVRTHPETGAKSLYVNQPFCTGVDGMDDEEGAALLSELYDYAAIPQIQCRFRWAENSLAQWDNRCTQHYASPDYVGHRRLVERVTMLGDKPF